MHLTILYVGGILLDLIASLTESERGQKVEFSSSHLQNQLEPYSTYLVYYIAKI